MFGQLLLVFVKFNGLNSGAPTNQRFNSIPFSGHRPRHPPCPVLCSSCGRQHQATSLHLSQFNFSLRHLNPSFEHFVVVYLTPHYASIPPSFRPLWLQPKLVPSRTTWNQLSPHDPHREQAQTGHCCSKKPTVAEKAPRFPSGPAPARPAIPPSANQPQTKALSAR